MLMCLMGQLLAVSEGRSVLGHQKVPVILTFQCLYLPISQFLSYVYEEQKILGGGDFTLFINSSLPRSPPQKKP